MNLEYLPILTIQRRLYDIPRGMKRFEAYLHEMTDEKREDIRLPITAMNPMGKEHVPEYLDRLIAMDAEKIGKTAMSSAQKDLQHVEGNMQVALVVVDDKMGGWTNRYASEYAYRFENDNIIKRNWIPVYLWTSEETTEAKVREQTLMAIYRTDYIKQFGHAKTLGEMMKQEGRVMSQSGCATPALSEDEFTQTEQIIMPHLNSTQVPILMSCLFGDEAAESLGYTPLGLKHFAGIELALAMENR